MASPGRVLIIVQNLPVPFDRRVWLEAKALTDSGYTVSVISPKGRKGDYAASEEELEGIQIYRYTPPPEAESPLGYIFEFSYCWVRTAWLSLKVARRQGIDILHACNPPETFFIFGWVVQRFGGRFIFDHHDLSPEMYVAKGGREGGLLHRGLLALERLTFKTADAVIATNQSHKAVAMERGGVSENRIFIVRSGPDTERLHITPVAPELKDGYRFLACYLGEMCPQDGVDYLLRAIDHLVSRGGHKDTRFVLMGGGPSLDDLRAMSHELNLDRYVTFTGRVSDEDLCRYLSTADVCLDPDPLTAWSDQSTMNKIMEYMAFGRPIVAFDLKETRRSAEGAAVYAPPNDTRAFAELVAELLGDPERRFQMGEIGRQRVHDELSWTYSVPNLLAAYRSVSKTRPGEVR
jgi:glycosyltransferase involved in cell wall biosynthesis